MSSYDEHLISQAGGDGEPSTNRKLTEHQAICIWEDHVGDSGKAPTSLELLTFANAARADLIALVREQAAKLEAVRELADDSVPFKGLHGYTSSGVVLANDLYNVLEAS